MSKKSLKTDHLRLRLTSDEKTRIEKLADKEGLPVSAFIRRVLKLAGVLGLLVGGCTSSPSLVANVTEPAPFTLSIAHGNFATTTDFYGAYGHALFVYIASDERSDNKGNPAPIRLGAVVPYGNDVQSVNATSVGGVELRDQSLGIDCNKFTGSETWVSQSSSWHFVVDASCDTNASVHVVADVAGNF